MRTRLLLVAGLAAVAVVVAITLAPSEPRRSGTNNVPLAGPVASLPPGAAACQREDVPEQTRVVRLHVDAADGRPRPVVRVGDDGASGRRVRRVADGTVDVTLARDAPEGSAEVCVRNAGARTLDVLGYPTGERRGRPTGPIAFDYYRAGSESWWQVAPAVAQRMSFGKSGLLGGWALWLAVALVLIAWALAARALWLIGAPER